MKASNLFGMIGAKFLTFSGVASASAVLFERLNLNNTAILVVDHQVGLINMVGDWDKTLFRNNILGHAGLAKLFNIPVVMTSSFQQGSNGPLMKEITDMYPNAPLIKRQGEINAWDNANFRAAVKATGKHQLVIAGILTEVCTAFLGLSLRAEGYSVWANVEASGTTTELVRDTANMRMQGAGINLVSLFSVVADLIRDYRSTAVDPVYSETWSDQYIPSAGFMTRAHAAAILNGTLIPGEANLVQ